MKKLLLLLTVLLLLATFSSCEKQTVTISQEEYAKLTTRDTIKSIYPKSIKISDRFNWKITLGSDSHEYCDNDAYHAYCCFHYVDCVKCKNKKDEKNNNPVNKFKFINDK